MSEKLAPIQCGETLDIAGVSAFHEILKSSLTERDTLELDGGALVRIDGAGLQLLASLFHSAEQHGRTIRWTEVSEPLAQAASLVGLDAVLRIGER